MTESEDFRELSNIFLPPEMESGLATLLVALVILVILIAGAWFIVWNLIHVTSSSDRSYQDLTFMTTGSDRVTKYLTVTPTEATLTTIPPVNTFDYDSIQDWIRVSGTNSYFGLNEGDGGLILSRTPAQFLFSPDPDGKFKLTKESGEALSSDASGKLIFGSGTPILFE